MEFTLFYRGPLKPNARPREKQELRRHFHPQLKALWQHPPLSEMKTFSELDTSAHMFGALQVVSDFHFVPLVSQQLHLTAELRITFLRPEPPGAIITKSGDIDNRLKTLLDALKMPREANEITNGDKPRDDERPFFCLLQDDSLIVRLDVTTDRLLEPCEKHSEVVLLIHVRTRATRVTYDNIGLS